MEDVDYVLDEVIKKILQAQATIVSELKTQTGSRRDTGMKIMLKGQRRVIGNQ